MRPLELYLIGLDWIGLDCGQFRGDAGRDCCRLAYYNIVNLKSILEI